MKKHVCYGLIWVLCWTGCSAPKPPAIIVENRAGFDAMEVVLIPSGTNQRGDNILPDDSLAFGASISCLLPPTPGVSAWDVKTLDADGHAVFWTGVVVRAGDRLILKMDGHNPVAVIE